MGNEERRWKVGEVAAATGLTVRALHHYHQIGLVTPSDRTTSGHRLYTGADLIALYRVTAMRQLGLPLDQIADLLTGKAGVREVIDEQLEQVDQQIRAAVRLRKELIAARDGTEGAAERFLEIIRLMQDLQGYLTQEQIQAMRRRLSELGVVAEHAIGVEIPRLYTRARDEMRAGTPPSDQAIRVIVDRLDELSRILRGGKTESGRTGTGTPIREMWLAKGRQQPDLYDSHDWDELVAYLDRARACRR